MALHRLQPFLAFAAIEGRQNLVFRPMPAKRRQKLFACQLTCPNSAIWLDVVAGIIAAQIGAVVQLFVISRLKGTKQDQLQSPTITARRPGLARQLRPTSLSQPELNLQSCTRF